MIDPIFILPGAAVGAGIALLISVLVPGPPALSVALERVAPVPVTKRSGRSQANAFHDRVGGAVLRQVAGFPGFSIPEVDLRLIGMTVNRYMTLKALFTTGFFLLPFIIGLLFQAMGLVAFYIPGLFGFPLAVLGWFIPNLTTKGEAENARAEFTRAVAVYLELVASERTRGAAPSRALESAASVGQSWVFVRLSQELAQARYAGIAAWDALERLGAEIDVPDLTELARRMRLSGEEGASVYETLRAQGKSLRNRLLNMQQTEANKSTTRMVMPMAMTGLVFMLLLGTPFILNMLFL